jgi:hypothetical protein
MRVLSGESAIGVEPFAKGDRTCLSILDPDQKIGRKLLATVVSRRIYLLLLSSTTNSQCMFLLYQDPYIS